LIKKNGFFTERKFKLSDPTSNGQGIDFSKDFKVINSQKITGETICRLISKQYELLKIYTIRLPGF
jgi:hypothetical protein